MINESEDLFDSCLIIDVKREYRALSNILSKKVEVLAIADEPRVEFNPLIPPSGVDPELWDRAFTDVFIRAYGLSEPSRRILRPASYCEAGGVHTKISVDVLTSPSAFRIRPTRRLSSSAEAQ